MERSLKDLKGDSAWNSKKAMRDQCLELLSGLDDAIALTEKQVQVRTAEQGFQLASANRLTPEEMGESQARPGTSLPSTELLLEHALCQRFWPDQASSGAPWRHLVHRQVPLHNVQQSNGWGKIDLLGMTEVGDPVVVELKKRTSADTPLHALLEAASYAIALRHNWPLLSRELGAHHRGIHVSSDPQNIPLVLIAPAPYWADWKRWSTTGAGVPADTSTVFDQLCGAFAQRKLPVARASVEYMESWDERSPLLNSTVSVTDVVYFSGWPA